MQTCEAPDLWGLHKNKNCAFLLKRNWKPNPNVFQYAFSNIRLDMKPELFFFHLLFKVDIAIAIALKRLFTIY